MTKMLRILGLTAIVALASLPQAGAAAGDCHVECNGNSWVVYTGDYGECCGLFHTLCGSYGDAYYELQTRWGVEPMYCPSYAPPEK